VSKIKAMNLNKFCFKVEDDISKHQLSVRVCFFFSLKYYTHTHTQTYFITRIQNSLWHTHKYSCIIYPIGMSRKQE